MHTQEYRANTARKRLLLSLLAAPANMSGGVAINRLTAIVCTAAIEIDGILRFI